MNNDKNGKESTFFCCICDTLKNSPQYTCYWSKMCHWDTLNISLMRVRLHKMNIEWLWDVLLALLGAYNFYMIQQCIKYKATEACHVIKSCGFNVSLILISFTINYQQRRSYFLISWHLFGKNSIVMEVENFSLMYHVRKHDLLVLHTVWFFYIIYEWLVYCW